MAPIIDVDSHVYEPAAIWEDYLPAAQRDRAKKAFHHTIDDLGNRTTTLNGQPAKDLNRSMLVRQALWKPGMTVEEIGQLDPQVFRPLVPGASDAKARLVDMDAMGVEQALVFPTLFAPLSPLRHRGNTGRTGPQHGLFGPEAPRLELHRAVPWPLGPHLGFNRSTSTSGTS